MVEVGGSRSDHPILSIPVHGKGLGILRFEQPLDKKE